MYNTPDTVLKLIPHIPVPAHSLYPSRGAQHTATDSKQNLHISIQSTNLASNIDHKPELLQSIRL